MHALLDLQSNIPSFIEITEAKLNDVNVLDILCPEPAAIDVMDRADVDDERLHTLHQVGSDFVVRATSNTTFQRRYSHKSDRNNGVIYDPSGGLTGAKSSRRYPRLLRRITLIDRENDNTLIFLTNNTYLPAETIAALYKNRWRVELFSMDEATSPHTILLQCQRKRRQNINLDRCFRLCLARHHSKTATIDHTSLHSFADC